MEAKRRAQLSGRPISQQEVEGVAKGFADTAATKNIAEQGLTQQKEQFSQTLAFEKEKDVEQRRIAEEERKHQKMRTIASGAGAVAGGVLGTIFATPGMGTIAGAAVGSQAGGAMYEIDPLKGVANSIFGGCIIISSCTSPNSYEVNIARGYRDSYMDEITLTGYYALCFVLVPLIRKYPRFKRLVKRILVDRLVAYGEAVLGVESTRHYRTSSLISKAFLGFCGALGSFTNTYLEARNA